jgi:hypothetical protein
MMVKPKISRMLTAAIVLIALAFAPSVGFAHSGHAHHAQAQHAAVLQSEQTLVPPASLENATSAQSAVPASPDRNCVAGCCISACAFCCVAGLPGSTELLPLARTMMRVSLPPTRTWASREPASLRRPPRSFT